MRGYLWQDNRGIYDFQRENVAPGAQFRWEGGDSKKGDAEKEEEEEKEICRQHNGKDKTTIFMIYIECA